MKIFFSFFDEASVYMNNNRMVKVNLKKSHTQKKIFNMNESNVSVVRKKNEKHFMFIPESMCVGDKWMNS